MDNYSEFVSALFKHMNDRPSTIHHAATGIAGEAGEVLDLSKKSWIYGKELDLVKLKEELGDVRFYYQAMLNLMEWTDEQIIQGNVEKLNKRYPDKQYSDIDAISRKDKDETIL